MFVTTLIEQAKTQAQVEAGEQVALARNWTRAQYHAKVKELNPRLARRLAATQGKVIGSIAPRKQRQHPDTGKILHRYGMYHATLVPLAGGPQLELDITAVARQYPRKERVDVDAGNMGMVTLSREAWERFLAGEGAKVILLGSWYSML